VAIGWIANPIALIRGKKLVIVVESAFWRVAIGQRASLKARIRESVTEFLARFFVNRADLLLFTQPAYRTSLLTSGRGKAFITPATWINDENILSQQEAERSWERKLADRRVKRESLRGSMVPGRDRRAAGCDPKTRQGGCELRVDVIGRDRADQCKATEQGLSR
jgi:hypothetical protein